MHEQLPRPVERFSKDHPAVWAAFNALGDSCHEAAGLDEKTRRLVKLAIAVGAGLEGGTHSAIRNALDAGMSAQELKAVALLAVTTIGFPASVRAMTWIEDGVAAGSSLDGTRPGKAR
jgi:alkylhydroperoxidase/carboxymuconolactone decarboxylase family protein YurZ